MSEVDFEDDDQLSDDNSEEINIESPFSTKDIKVNIQTISLASLISRLKKNEIDLQPSFQRKGNLWNKTQMSRLIESILLKMPLPIFYFDVASPDCWLVVDGLQRLSTIERFAVDKKLKLANLEFLSDLNAKGFDDLPRAMQRVIEETQIVTYQIEPQTPKTVRYSIFKRINTGGLRLNAQEIRHALNQKGIAAEFLEAQSQTEEFTSIVNLNTDRMLDRELVLRFFAFKLLPVDQNFKSLASFLDRAIEEIDKNKEITMELESLAEQLKEALVFSEELLGENHKFSRAIANQNAKSSLNRSLFDVLTVCFSEIRNKEAFILKAAQFKHCLKEMIRDETSVFSKAIYQGTGSKKAVQDRFSEMRTLINKIEETL